MAIAAGSSYSLALLADGTVLSWGVNDYGQTTIPSVLRELDLPILVSGAVDVHTPGVYRLTHTSTSPFGLVSTITRTVVAQGPL